MRPAIIAAGDAAWRRRARAVIRTVALGGAALVALVLPVSFLVSLAAALYEAFFVSTARDDPLALSIVTLLLPTIATGVGWMIYVGVDLRRVFRTTRFK